MKGKYNKHIFICTNERGENSQRMDCASCGGKEIRLEFVKLINQYGLKGKVRANKSGCLDVCELGAAVVIYPENIWYLKVKFKVKDVKEIFEKLILKDEVIKRLVADKNSWRELEKARKRL